MRCADELQEAVRPREHRVFFGALDASSLGATERLMRLLPGGRSLLPLGDYRDWDRMVPQERIDRGRAGQDPMASV